MICIVSLLINAHTLRDSFATRRRILASGQNHGADIWSWNSIRSKGCFVVVQMLLTVMAADRVLLLHRGYIPGDMLGHWIVFGGFRTVIACFVAFTAWTNMMSYRRLRDGE